PAAHRDLIATRSERITPGPVGHPADLVRYGYHLLFLGQRAGEPQQGNVQPGVPPLDRGGYRTGPEGQADLWAPQPPRGAVPDAMKGGRPGGLADGEGGSALGGRLRGALRQPADGQAHDPGSFPALSLRSQVMVAVNVPPALALARST